MTTTREEQRDVVDDPTYSLEVVHGKAGDCVCLNDRRICGPKPWGGGRITSTWSVRRSDILAAIPDLEAENDRLRASQAGGVPAGWPTDGIIMKDYWRDAIGSAYVPVKYSKHASWHPTTVKAELEAHRGEPVADVLAGMVFTLSINADREDLAWKRVAELEAELRDLRASPPPPATDGDALREALVAEVTRIAADCEGVADNHRKGWRNEPPTHAAMWDRLARELRNALASSPPPVPEIVAPQVVSDATADTGSASAAHLEQILPSPDLGQAAELVKPQCDNPSPAALASVPTPVSDGDSVLRKAVALVITHHVNQNRQKRRPESDSFTLKTLREALAATPVSATDAVEAERAKWAAEVAEISDRLRVVETIQDMVRADEREACAKIADARLAEARAVADQLIAQIDAQQGPSTRPQRASAMTLDAIGAASSQIAARIRARGTETGEEWGHGRRWNERADRLNEAVLAEREACAKVADREERLREGSAIFACIAIAAVIRARSKADSALGADASTEGGVDA